MILFEIHEARTFFEGPEEELECMYECLRIKDKNAWFRARYVLRKLGYFHKPSNEEDQEEYEKIIENSRFIKFYEKRSKSFGTGLLPLVKKHLKEQEIPCQVTDLRKPMPSELMPEMVQDDAAVRFHFKDKIEVREEQLDVLRTAIRKQRGILHCAPNFGKTEVACAIVAVYHKATGQWPRTLFLIHRTGLAEQTRKRFEKHLGIEVARVSGGKKQLRRITVATTQTAARLVQKNSFHFKEFLQKCDIVFVDELHVNKAKQATRVMNLCRARLRFGLSGTVNKSNNAKMMHFMGLTGPVIAEVRNVDLVALGRSAKPIIRMVKVETDLVVGSFAESYRLAVVRNNYRNDLILKEAIRHVDKGRRTLITVGRINHGRILRDLIEKDTDLRTDFIHGGTSLHVRDRIKKRFIKRKLPILIASPIFDVGEDLPEIDAWVNAAGGKGWELVLQRLGRTMRKKEGENKVYISDFLDMHNKYMAKHSLVRMQYYLDEKVCKVKVVK